MWTWNEGSLFLQRILLSAVIFFSGLVFSKDVAKKEKNPLLSEIISKRLATHQYPPLPALLADKIEKKVVRKEAATTQFDSSLTQSWGLKNIGLFEIYTPLLQPMNSLVKACSSEIVVAIIDTGIDYSHPELLKNVWVNSGESGPLSKNEKSLFDGSCRDRSCNGIDDDGNGFVDDFMGWNFVGNNPFPYDTHGHGTHIAGIIAAESGNGVGISGVCPNVSIMPLKYYDQSGVGFNNLQNTVRAIQYAVKMGAHVINYSGGGAEPAPLERLQIELAEKKGILFVAAAGNDSHNNDLIPYYPASYGLDNIVAVGSVDKENHLLPSSNYGPRSVHVVAPGLSILSTIPGGRYGTMSGTSQATAYVTGIAALLGSQTKKFNFASIKKLLIEGSKVLPQFKSRMTGGLVSVSTSLQSQRKESPSQSPKEIAIKLKD